MGSVPADKASVMLQSLAGALDGSVPVRLTAPRGWSFAPEHWPAEAPEVLTRCIHEVDLFAQVYSSSRGLARLCALSELRRATLMLNHQGPESPLAPGECLLQKLQRLELSNCEGEAAVDLSTPLRQPEALPKLMHLTLDFVVLAELPSTVLQLPALRELHLKYLELWALPPLAGLRHLTCLTLAHMDDKMVVEPGVLRGLSSLQHLEMTHMKALPAGTLEDIAGLHALRRLVLQETEWKTTGVPMGRMIGRLQRSNPGIEIVMDDYC